MKSSDLFRLLALLLITALLGALFVTAFQPLSVGAAGEQSALRQATETTNGQAHITDGVAVLGIVLVVIVLIGVIWGSRVSGKGRTPKK